MNFEIYLSVLTLRDVRQTLINTVKTVSCVKFVLSDNMLAYIIWIIYSKWKKYDNLNIID